MKKRMRIREAGKSKLGRVEICSEMGPRKLGLRDIHINISSGRRDLPMFIRASNRVLQAMMDGQLGKDIQGTHRLVCAVGNLSS